MKVVLYMAVSADGYVAGPHGETPWSEAEWETYAAFVRQHGNLIVGHRTYDIMKREELRRIGDPFVVVVAHHHFADGLAHAVKTPQEALLLVERHGFTTAVLGGGPTVNQSFLEANLVDEIILDVENVQLGGGLKLFGVHDVLKEFMLTNEKTITPNLKQQYYTRRT